MRLSEISERVLQSQSLCGEETIDIGSSETKKCEVIQNSADRLRIGSNR